MGGAKERYLDIYKAAYDYDAQDTGELSMAEDQMLFLLDDSDSEWYKVKLKPKSQDEKSPVGLVPANYVEPASPIWMGRALYDYEATADDELTITEDEALLVYDKEEDWSLVKSQTGKGIGFVPTAYIGEGEGAEEEPTVTEPARIVVPDSPPRPIYVDPAERVAATSDRSNIDPVETWTVSLLDKKGKKKKGTLGVGKGSIYFASESDKTPVQQWKSADMISVSSDKKNIRLEIGGSNGDTLSLISKEHYDAIVRKLESSHALSKEPSLATPTSGPAPLSAATPVKNAEPKSVHWANSPDSEIPPRSPSPDEPAEDDQDGTMGIALYDFNGDAADELSVKEGEILLVVDRSNEDWWKCRNQVGQEGVIPASYIDLDADGTPAPTHEDSTENDVEDSAEREREVAAAAAAAAATKREKERKERERVERVEREEEEERARAAEQKRVAEERRKAEELKKKAAEAAKQRKLVEEQAKTKSAREKDKERGRRRKKEDGGSSSGEGPEEIIRKHLANKRREADERRDPALRNSLSKASPPEPGKTRVWHDRSGQFRVEAEFKGFENGKLRLHKTNGVTIEVPAEKMSAEDMAYIARLTGKQSSTPVKPTSPRPNDDNIPLAKLQAASKAAPVVAQSRPDPQPKKHVDWFEFFLNAGCDMDDCTRYTAAFERDKIDETLLPDLKADTLRSLGLREGDILRTLKAIEKKWVSKSRKEDPLYRQQLEADRKYAERVQEAEYSGKQPPPPPGPIPQLKSTSPAPNLFSGPGGALKDNTRRGRPTPSVNTRAGSTNVNESVLESASAQLVRGSSPATASPIQPSLLQPVAAPKPVAAVGFDDDDAWAVRPSSAKPTPATSATPPVAPASAPPAPPAPAPAIAVQPPERPQTTSTVEFASLTPEQDLLAKIAELASSRRPPSAPVSPAVAAPPITSATPPAFVPSPSLSAPIPSFNPNALRGPFAPIPANEALLKPLVPTNTGMVGFIPTRSNTNLSPSPILPQHTSFLNQSFMNPSPTGINSGSTGFHPALAPQPTGFTPSLGLSPTGYMPSLAAQPTGFPSFIGTQPTGFHPGFGGMGGTNAGIPPVPPLPSNLSSFNALSAPSQSLPPLQPAAPNHSPANVFASMKAGNFGGEEQQDGPQKYDALRGNTGLQPQPTGWVPGFQPQFQPAYGSFR